MFYCFIFIFSGTQIKHFDFTIEANDRADPRTNINRKRICVNFRSSQTYMQTVLYKITHWILFACFCFDCNWHCLRPFQQMGFNLMNRCFFFFFFLLHYITDDIKRASSKKRSKLNGEILSRNMYKKLNWIIDWNLEYIIWLREWDTRLMGKNSPSEHAYNGLNHWYRPAQVECARGWEKKLFSFRKPQL